MPKKHTADDDSESQKRTDVQSPEVCVDYLSYTFDEMDLAASWRMMTKQKKDIVNGIRLENASWRTWAKQRNHLKTISPETLNWLKDSDVTWLYGPLHTVTKSDQNDRYAPKESSAHDKFGLIHASDPPLTDKDITGTPSAPPLPSTTVTRSPSSPIINIPVGATSSSLQQPQQPPQPQQPQPQRPLKSALKKVTMSDILRRSASEFHVSDLNEAGGSSMSLSEANRQLGVFSPAVIATHRQPKLRFNQRVEQYMVISDDDGSSANGSLPKVKMTANLPSRYDVYSSDRTDASAAGSGTGRHSDSNNNGSNHGGNTNNRTNDNDDGDSSTDDGQHEVVDESDNEIGPSHNQRHSYRNESGQLYHRASHYMVSSDDDDDDDDNDDDDDDDDGGLIMQHHHHYSNSKSSNNNNTPRSIKRIEPTILKCSSSYSDNSIASSLSRRGSLSSWDDNDDDDRRSVHLPSYQLDRQTTSTTSDQSIQWEGQTCVVYDVAPSDAESDFVDDDWDLQRHSNDDDDDNGSLDDGSLDDGSPDDDTKDDSDSENDNIVINYGTGEGSNISRQKSPMQVDVAKSKQSVDPPLILSPGKASKSQPTSEPSDATHSHTTNHPSSSRDDRSIDRQQQSSPSVFGNLGQWASSYFWKS